MGVGKGAYIHPIAWIDDTVEIGARTKVWQFASVIRKSEIGRNCVIGSCAIVDGARLGDECKVEHGASVNPGVWCGSNVFIGPNATLCNDRWPSASREGFDLGQFREGLVTIFVHDRASIGANAVVLPGMTIGQDAMVAAGAVVNRSVPDGHLFTRAGKIFPIRPEQRNRRMFAA